ncbi:MAG: PIG-L family deacetylase [Ignavibacteriaceae bacterium]|nr:PIG-L family deacetylase [Ignavibacteriaceae bacterium]
MTKALILISFLILKAHIMGQPYKLQSPNEILLSIEKLKVTGTVLYVAAHPDDENTAMLSYFAKGRLFHTAYLSLTRGDGGQNLIGREKWEEIGVIRTRELLEARKIDGAVQFFTSAVDFGYSKSVDETLTYWNEQELLKDMVYIIRYLKPDLIITRFPPSNAETHGHHLTSAALAVKAFNLSNNPEFEPVSAEKYGIWQPLRIYWNRWLRTDSEKEMADRLLNVNIGEYNTLLSKSYSEIAAESRTQHKSQGFGAGGRRGDEANYFEYLDGAKAEKDILEGIDFSWSRIKGAEAIPGIVDEIIRKFDVRTPSAVVSELVKLYSAISLLPRNHITKRKSEEVKSIIKSCLGLWAEAISPEEYLVKGQKTKLNFTIVNRSGEQVKLKSVSSAFTARNNYDVMLADNKPFSVSPEFKLPDDASLTNKYWLENERKGEMFNIPERGYLLYPDNNPEFTVTAEIEINGTLIEYNIPVYNRIVDRVEGEVYRSVIVRPEVILSTDEPVLLSKDGEYKNVTIHLESVTPGVSGRLRLVNSEDKNDVIELGEVTFANGEKNYDFTKSLTIKGSKRKKYDIEFITAGGVFNRTMKVIDYPHFPKQHVFTKSRITFVLSDVRTGTGKVAYIQGSGDDIPKFLTQLGVEIEEVEYNALSEEFLKEFRTVIFGIRAFNVIDNPDKKHNILNEYIANGGNVIFQYLTVDTKTNKIGPYPFKIGRQRVTDEDMLPSFLDEKSALLASPNKIGIDDFRGWVQEKGLYFASEFSSEFTTPVKIADKGETESGGVLITAKYGKGSITYTGFSFFRQLPAGVEGAVKLLLNLIYRENQ